MQTGRKRCATNVSLTILNAGISPIQRFHHHADSFFTVDLDADRFVETDMPYKCCFLYRRQCVEVRFIKETVVLQKGIHRKVTHPEGGKVLKEMGALTRLDTVVLQTLLHDHPRL